VIGAALCVAGVAVIIMYTPREGGGGLDGFGQS
jgi:hypothetical protein